LNEKTSGGGLCNPVTTADDVTQSFPTHDVYYGLAVTQSLRLVEFALSGLTWMRTDCCLFFKTRNISGGRSMGQSEQGEDFPNNDLSFTSNITSINSKQYGDANAHTAAIELLEITIKTLKTTQSRDEVIDPIPQITTIFTNPITTTPG
jgi:hypothetical protein